MANCAGEMQIRPLMNHFTWHSLFFVLSVYCDCVLFFFWKMVKVLHYGRCFMIVLYLFIQRIAWLALSRWTVSVCLCSQLFCKHIPSFSWLTHWKPCKHTHTHIRSCISSQPSCEWLLPRGNSSVIKSIGWRWRGGGGEVNPHYPPSSSVTTTFLSHSASCFSPSPPSSLFSSTDWQW